MASVLVLEQPGRWRSVATASLLFLLTLPLLPLWAAALNATAEPLGPGFWRSLRTSIELGGCSAFVGLLVGLPLGVGSALTKFRGRRLLLLFIGLPLVVPSFLWAIGWSTLGGGVLQVPGFLGCLLVGVTTTTPLVLLASHAGTLEVSGAQLEAALLAGGEATLLRTACRHVAVPALLAAAFGGVLVLSDAGPGQILGVHTVGAEILTTFSARYDLPLAAKQCAALMLVVAALALPLAWVASPRIARAMFARQLRNSLSEPQRWFSAVVCLGLVAFLAMAVLPPLVGLLKPLVAGGAGTLRVALWISDENWAGNHIGLALFGAAPRAARTVLNSILYAGGAGLIATLVAALVALSVGRSSSLRAAVLAACLVLFSWPSVASALGVAQLAAGAPGGIDFLLRSRFTVCVVLALHLAPVAVVLLLRSADAIPTSWTFAAAIHGVDLRHYARRVLWPAFLPSLASSFTLVALLASADAGSILLLHPPGEASLGLAIVTVMANAPEAFVAVLCLIYLLGAIGVLAAVFGFASSSRAPR